MADVILYLTFATTILTLAINAAKPVLDSAAYCIKHIKSSSCCGGKIDLDKSDKDLKKLIPKVEEPLTTASS